MQRDALSGSRCICSRSTRGTVSFHQNPEEITAHVDINAASRIEWNDIKDALIPKGINFVVIDNRACDYQDIIRFICKNANSGTFFATYLSEADRVIYPKMN